MSPLFEELDYRETPIGALSLRRRRDLTLGVDVFEIKLGEEFLMSSNFTASEVALAELGLAALQERAPEVMVAGLGLGYTARAVLLSEAVASLTVVEKLAPVIDWHRAGLLPLGPELTGDPRCRLIEGDFFQLAAGGRGLDPERPGQLFDAILVDIDHSPDFLLDPANAGFYTVEGLKRLKAQLKPGGVFGLWSNDPPDADFIGRLGRVFPEAWAETVSFHNPLRNARESQAVYLARRGDAA